RAAGAGGSQAAADRDRAAARRVAQAREDRAETPAATAAESAPYRHHAKANDQRTVNALTDELPAQDPTVVLETLTCMRTSTACRSITRSVGRPALITCPCSCPTPSDRRPSPPSANSCHFLP